MKTNNMTNKQLIDATESIKTEMYAIIRREQNKLSGEFKATIKTIIDERIKRGELRISPVNYGCGDCVVTAISEYILPWLESTRYTELQASLNDTVQMNMVPDEPTGITVGIKVDGSSLKEYVESDEFKEVAKDIEAMKLTDEELNEKIREAILVEKSVYNPDERSITMKADIDKDKMKEIASTAPAKKTRKPRTKK